MSIKISQLPPLPGLLDGTEPCAVVQGGVTYRATSADWIALADSLRGPKEFDITTAIISTTVNTGDTITHPDLVGLDNITYLEIESTRYPALRFTYTSGNGKIQLLNGDTFADGYSGYLEFKKNL